MNSKKLTLAVRGQKAHQQLKMISTDLAVQQVCGTVLDDPRFGIWTASAKPYTHHYGVGGLAVHTLEVYDLAISAYLNVLRTEEESRTDTKRLIFLAVVFHDVGKLWDYEPVDNIKPIETWDWQTTKHKELIHHISRSALVWDQARRRVAGLGYPGREYEITETMFDEVYHAILAHHGQKEWGSPVTPKTKLAWLIHTCDHLSARYDDCENERPEKY